MIPVTILKTIDLFKSFTEDELAEASALLSIEKFSGGDHVSNDGDSEKFLYMVLNGRIVSTLKLPGTISRRHGEFIAGDIFGESRVFAGKPLVETYIAAENCELLFFPESYFTSMIDKNPVCATRIISALLSRTIKQLRKSSGFLAQIVQWGENASRRVITDELTGIYNRAFLDDALESFFNISKSNNKPLSLLMLDVDNCRKINDMIDHDTGNMIIREFVVIIKKVISKYGIVARYGGDEFSILLPETNLEQAAAIAEKLRSDVEQYDFSKFLQGHDIRITTSVGISSFPETVTDFASFKKKADESLYLAKESGRNRVSFIR